MEFEHKVGAFDDEGLVVADKEKKDWKGIVISLLVIGNIMGAIIVAIILCTPDGDVDLNKAKLEFDLITSDQYRIEVFNGSWLSENEIVYVDQNGSIVIFDAETNKSSSMLVKTYDKTLHTMEAFKLSPDRQSILFVSDMRYEFGAQVSGRYAIFNISSQTVEFLDDLIKSTDPLKTPQIQYASWGPAGSSSSNSIVFIESDDIYFVPDFNQYNGLGASMKYFNNDQSGGGVANSAGRLQAGGAAAKYLRLTKSGAQSEFVRNGLPDSLYRTSIFNQKDEATLWWSPDGRYLAYLSFDGSQIEPSPIEFYDSYMNDGNYSPKIHYERLPRAGDLNSRVSVNIVDLMSPIGSESDIETSTIAAPAELNKQQQTDPRLSYYVTYVSWLGVADSTSSSSAAAAALERKKPNQLLIMWSNRAQTTSVLTACENANEHGSLFGSRANDWKCELLTSFSQRIPPSTNARRTILSATNANGTRLVFFALPRPDSAIGDHYHVAMLREGERAPKYLTHGEFDVDRLISYEPTSDTLYFEAKVSERAERHLYQFSSIGQLGGPERHTRCLTCQLAEPCGYNYAHISPKSRFLVHECLGPAIPVTRLRVLAATGSQQPQPQQQQTRLSSQPSDNATAANVGAQPLLRSITVLGKNANIETLIKNKQMPIEKFIAIKANQQSLMCDIYLKLYLPSEIEDEKDKRFPLLIEASELDQRNVWLKFDLDWGKYLASRKQIIYAKLDCVRPKQLTPMSSSGQYSQGASGGGSLGALVTSSGGAFRGQLDEDQLINSAQPLFNAKDQADAIKFLAENGDLFPYIDRRRIAIYGPSSTSAYMALATTINDDSKLIQCTVAVSPITNWRYMSSYAAEHHLGLPWLDANSLKYERANLLKRSYEFSLRKLLIVHGTADEQVHVQHSMQFLKSLTEHHITGGVLHQAQFYPDVGHSLAQVRRHFYLTLDGFVDRCFYQKPIAIKATEWKGKVRPKTY